MTKIFKISPFLALSFVAAGEIVLDEISVTANSISSKTSSLNKNDIKKGHIYNERDLVRNEPGVAVTEGGRSGNNGYAIRGVESDRVSVKVDGVEAAQSFMPRFYYIKGMMNGNRNSTEIENLSSIEFSKGADSLTKGSGAIGGSVSMKTKSVNDFVQDGENVGFYSKSAYASKNNEFRQVSGVGVKAGGFEALFQHTYKRGHEDKNYFSGHFDDVAHCGTSTDGTNITDKFPHLCGFGRILPDSANFTVNSRLVKFGYRFDEHFINSFYEDSKQKYYTEQKSNTVASVNRRNFTEGIPYKRYGIYYEYEPNNNAFLSYLKVGVTKQKVEQKSSSIQYNGYVYQKHNALWNDKPEFIRNFDFKQEITQLDLSGISDEFRVFDTSHIFEFGLGRHAGKFSNHNITKGYKYPYDSSTYEFILGAPPQIKTENFVYQQPINNEILYAYLSDNVTLRDDLLLNFGLRADKYHYKPKNSGLPYENKYQELTANSAKFSALSYKAGFEWDFAPEFSLGYSFSTGFRAPSVEDMYFEMAGVNSSLMYSKNENLKPEKAQNHEITLKNENDNYAFSAGVFYTRYNDFIDMDYNIKVKEGKSWSGKTYYTLDKITLMSTNTSSAYVKGIEFNARIQGGALNLSNNLYATLKTSYAKGRKSDGSAMMAISPLTTVIGIGYDDERFNMQILARFVAAKKQKDAMDKLPPNSMKINVDYDNGKVTGIPDIESHPYLSRGYGVYDLTASYKINKNFSINAGIFNIFDKKYTTWENLRQLKHNGNLGTVLENGAVGIERYTAARRNFAVSFEARF